MVEEVREVLGMWSRGIPELKSREARSKKIGRFFVGIVLFMNIVALVGIVEIGVVAPLLGVLGMDVVLLGLLVEERRMKEILGRVRRGMREEEVEGLMGGTVKEEIRESKGVLKRVWMYGRRGVKGWIVLCQDRGGEWRVEDVGMEGVLGLREDKCKGR